ncbi:hypothetical protein [Glycocaulis sp.]
MTFNSHDRISVFGALRPDTGQSVSKAVIATYSLDLIALLGLVLTLGGDAEAEFENSPLGLVKAFDSVRGKLRVLHQTGRILAPRAHRAILPLLDTMVEAIVSNEAKQSWHPKVALVRYEAEPQTNRGAKPKAGAQADRSQISGHRSSLSVQWRFWIGSRNLTGSRDLDAGLMLVSSSHKSARLVPDIEKLATGLLAEAGFTTTELDELRSMRWAAPHGVAVRRLLWRRPGETLPFLTTPLLARCVRSSAVSPFVDSTGLKAVLHATSQRVSVLTTDMAAGDCRPVEGVEFRTRSAPEPETPVSIEQQTRDREAEFTEQPSAGIHAKLLAVTNGNRTALMIGSANLTRRGLVGPNAEAIAILDVTNAELSDSLHKFVQTGIEFEESQTDEELTKQVEKQRQLDAQISLLLECGLRLAYTSDGLWLVVDTDADAALALARFEVAPFLGPDAWVQLSGADRMVRLLQKAVPRHEQTSFISFRATSLDDPQIHRSWVQSLPVAGLDQDRRNMALLAHYVGANRFRDWLRSQLDGIDATVGERWSDERTVGAPSEISLGPEIFTLEAMLSAWARDPKAFERRIADMITMLESFREAFVALQDEEERRAALADLADVQPFIEAVHDAIRGRA